MNENHDLHLCCVSKERLTKNHDWKHPSPFQSSDRLCHPSSLPSTPLASSPCVTYPVSQPSCRAYLNMLPLRKPFPNAKLAGGWILGYFLLTLVYSIMKEEQSWLSAWIFNRRSTERRTAWVKNINAFKHIPSAHWDFASFAVSERTDILHFWIYVNLRKFNANTHPSALLLFSKQFGRGLEPLRS